MESFFSQGEQTINDKFNSLANALSGTPSSSLAGGGSTIHSAFTATPKGGADVADQFQHADVPSTPSTRTNWERLGRRRSDRMR